MTKIFSNLAGTHESAHLRSSVHFKQDKLRQIIIKFSPMRENLESTEREVIHHIQRIVNKINSQLLIKSHGDQNAER